MRTYYRLFLFFKAGVTQEVLWYSDKPLKTKDEIVQECVRDGHLLDTFARFVTAVTQITQAEYLETMYED
jgi:hypothetical protein